MPFPTPKTAPTTPPITKPAPATAAPEPKQGTFEAIVKPKDLDSLLSELNTPKQDFTPKEPEAPTPGSDTPEAFAAGFFDDDEPTGPAIDPTIARRSGRYIAKTVDTGIGFLAATISKTKGDLKKYQATPSELNDLEEAFADVAQEYNWNIPPYMNIILIMMVIYLPKFKTAFSDRIDNLNERVEKIEKNQKS